MLATFQRMRVAAAAAAVKLSPVHWSNSWVRWRVSRCRLGSFTPRQGAKKRDTVLKVVSIWDRITETLAIVSLTRTGQPYTLAHEENVRFVSEAWQQVEEQLGAGSAGESGLRPVQYVERNPNPRLQGFVPIDLDEWWAQQFLARVTNCS